MRYRALLPLLLLLAALTACQQQPPDPEAPRPEAAATAAEGQAAEGQAAERQAAEGLAPDVSGAAPQTGQRSATEAPDRAAFEADLAALQSIQSRVVVTLPDDVTYEERLPTVFFFHGYGWHPGFVEQDLVQAWADAHGWAFVGVSATNLRIAGRFDWSEVDEHDFARVDAVRDALYEHGPFDPTRSIATGFSQGGVLAAKLLAAQPDRWRGAVALSPGAVHHQPVLADADLTGHRVVVTAGAAERGSIVSIARQFDAELRARGAAVELRLTEGMSEHTFPPDFETLLPLWVQAMLVDPEGSGAVAPAGQ